MNTKSKTNSSLQKSSNKSVVVNTEHKRVLRIEDFDKMTLEKQQEFIMLIGEDLKRIIDNLYNNKNYIYILN